jgi:DNA polymerase I-like protein with 3'-5' exonuclease and polymerase domains
MKVDALRQEGYRLLHEGLIEFAQMEANGIRIDVPCLQMTKEQLKDNMRLLRREMEQDDVLKIWRKRYGAKTNITSREQLGEILHKEMGYKVSVTTESGRPKMDEEALSKIDHPFVKKLSRYLKYDKALGTFIKGIESQLVGDRLHPHFNLNLVRTYRSSSDSPNFQNFPVRDKEISQIIRSLFVSSTGCVLAENDFKGIEVMVSACYHHDPVFINYLTGGGDMHKDMAAQIYMLEDEWDELDPKMAKDIRYGAKNRFVFPQFYGDYYVACAKNCWEWIRQGKLTGPDGKSLYEHLKRKGIKKLGALDPEEEPEPNTFEAHLKDVEDDFWNRRFRVYGKWRRDWYRTYLDRGYFDLLTGFRIQGMFNRNAVTNYPVQGSAFHCLLWSLIQVNRMLRRYRMKSMIVGQIHDSMLGDVPVGELRDYWEIVEQVTMVDLRKHYEWLNVPLEIEFEIVTPNRNWFGKQECKFKEGRFLHPDDAKISTTDPVKFVKAMDRKANDAGKT